MVGGGVCSAPEQLELFEDDHQLGTPDVPPGAAIAFNSTPEDTFDAAARWISSG